jgi:hypothetical protein
MCFRDNKFDLHNIPTKLLQTAAPIMSPTNQSANKQTTKERIPWSRDIPEKLTGSRLVKIFPAFYGT